MKKFLLTLMLSSSFFGLILATNSSQAEVQNLNTIVAVVNNDIITKDSLNYQVNLMKRQMQLTHQTMPSNTQLRKKVLNQLIDQTLILQVAKKNQITVSNAQLESAIGNIAKQNHINVANLIQQVKQQGMGYDAYKKQIRKQLIMNAIERQVLGGNIQVTAAEVNAALQKEASKIQNIPEYHLEAMLVPVPNAPTPDLLQAAQKKANDIIQQLHNGVSFSTIALTESFQNQPLQGGDMGWKQLTQLPPIIAGEIAGAITGSILGPVQTPNGFYIFKVLATRSLNATHNVHLVYLRMILLKQDETETGNFVKAKLENIREQIIKGASFAKMAEMYSQDSATSQKGGKLGWVAANELPEKLSNAIKHLKKDEISQPIQTQDGWQIVQIEGFKTVNNSKANLKQQIRQMIYVQKFETAVKIWVQQLRSNAYIKIMS